MQVQHVPSLSPLPLSHNTTVWKNSEHTRRTSQPASLLKQDLHAAIPQRHIMLALWPHCYWCQTKFPVLLLSITVSQDLPLTDTMAEGRSGRTHGLPGTSLLVLSQLCTRPRGKEGKIQQKRKGSQVAHGLSPGIKAVVRGKQEAALPMPCEHCQGFKQSWGRSIQGFRNS